MEIIADPHRLRTEKSEINFLTESLRSNMNEIEALVLGTNGEWQGDAEVAYAGKIIYVKSQYMKLINFLEQYAEVIGAFAEQYEDYERQLAQKIELA